MKFIDGTAVDDASAANLARWVRSAADAAEIFTEDELEAAAKASRQDDTLPI